MGRFQDVLHNEIEGIDTLPLLHTCDAYFLRPILETRKLLPKSCGIFNEELLYAYYGLPSYRSNYSKSTLNPAYYPCCFILNPTELGELYKMFPLDSGAFESIPEIKEMFFHRNSKIIDFEIEAKMENAKKIIKTFYGTNEQYISQQPNKNVLFSALDFEANGYHNLINYRGGSIADDRASSIEIIFNKEINLDNSSVFQVIIPKCFKDDIRIMNLLKDNLGIEEPLSYDTHRGNPKEYFGLIRSEYLKFLEK
ncbi:MAG: hypothetical protein PSV16_00555 [Flavobacterium sp.]|nr:hypothetical protein [Flavobacterium sp.]